MSSLARATRASFVGGRVLDRRVERRSISGGVVTESGGPTDLPPLLLDRRQFVQPDLVDGRRVQVERGPTPDGGPVQLGAAGSRPQSWVRTGRGEVRTRQGFEERDVSRTDDIADDLPDPLPVLLRRDLDHRWHDRLLRRERQHPLDLGDRALSHDPWSRQTGCHPVVEDLDVRLDVRGVRVEAGDERIEALRRIGRLELGQLGQQLLGTTHLVDHAQLMGRLVVRLDAQAGDDLEDVQGDPGFGRKARRVDRVGLGDRSLHERAGHGPASGTRVLEPVVIARVAVDRRRGRVKLEDRLPERSGELVDLGRRWIGSSQSWTSMCCRAERRVTSDR